jgi:hypothetical protein
MLIFRIYMLTTHFRLVLEGPAAELNADWFIITIVPHSAAVIPFATLLFYPFNAFSRSASIHLSLSLARLLFLAFSLALAPTRLMQTHRHPREDIREDLQIGEVRRRLLQRYFYECSALGNVCSKFSDMVVLWHAV